MRIVAAVGEYDPARKGFVVTFTIDEGEQYKFGTRRRSVERARDRSGQSLREPSCARRPATSTTPTWSKRRVEDMTIEAAKRGYAFATVRPRGDRDFETQARSIVVFVVEEGPRAYIERINIRGNTRTRDYVIRREFDIGEGDAYNRALIDRAERRLKNLNFFKTVKITNEPGSAPDRVVDQCRCRGKVDRRVLGLGRLFDRRRLPRRSQRRRAQPPGPRPVSPRRRVTYGQRARGFDLSFVEPYLLGYRMALGLDLFSPGDADVVQYYVLRHRRRSAAISSSASR